jgi:hypothetical protein
LLHAWFHLFGDSLHSALGLNVLLFFLSALLIVRIGQQLDLKPLYISIACGFWLLGAVSLTTVLMIRHYTLLSFIFLACYFCLKQLLKKGRHIHYFWLALCLLAGFLTHYQFMLYAFLLLTTVLLIDPGTRIKTSTKWVSVYALFLLMLGFASIMDPGYWMVFEKQQGIQQYHLDAPSLMNRVDHIRHTFVRIFLNKGAENFLYDHRSSETLLIAAIVFVVYSFLLIRLKAIRQFFQPIRAEPLAIFGIIALTIAGLYLIGINPNHAMEARYILISTPFLYLFIGGLFQLHWKLFRMPPWLILSLCIALLYWQYRYAEFRSRSIFLSIQQNDFKPAPALGSSNNPVVVPYKGRGHIPLLIRHIPDQTPVFIAQQPYVEKEIRNIVKGLDQFYMIVKFNHAPMIKQLDLNEAYACDFVSRHNGISRLYKFTKL